MWGTSLAFSYPFFNLTIYPNVPATYKSTNKTIIVTGATGNLGSALAYDLARRKMRVVMACRDLEKCRMIRRELVILTGNHKILCRHLDLEDIESIDRFVAEITKSEPHIDVLINNAAVKDVPDRELTKYGIEKNYFVNFLAPFLLTSKLLDKLKESAAITRNSRVVNVIGGPKKDWEVDTDDINFEQRPYDSQKAYKQSKLALAYFTILLDKLNREQKNCVYVYGSNPGRKNIVTMLEHPDGLWEYAVGALKSYLRPQPVRVVQSSVRCALDPEVTEPGMSGKLYAYMNAKWFWGKAAKDEKKSKMVWNMATEKLAQLQMASGSNNVSIDEDSNNKDAPS